MTIADRWLLPEGVEEILPPEAFKLESLRRQILDLYANWGYELVITPLIEYLDSLLVGTSRDLELHTVKITDQLTGRMMGVRADITPQVARIDAHCLNRNDSVRLCYADSVLHTKPRGLLASRVPIRIGAELYGHSGVECDIELICLMAQTLVCAQVKNVHLVLGHVGIFRSLIALARLSKDSEIQLFDAMQRKAYDDIDRLLESLIDEDDTRTMLHNLSRLSGDETVLPKAMELFSQAPDSVRQELAELESIANAVHKRLPELNLCFDLCELRGYEYHTGIVFAAYCPGYGRAIAKGGRYDHIGEVFGRSRPASGFDSDLKTIAKLSELTFEPKMGVVAPYGEDPELLLLIQNLRNNGEKVIKNLSAETLADEAVEQVQCNRQIIYRDEQWVVENI